MSCARSSSSANVQLNLGNLPPKMKQSEIKANANVSNLYRFSPIGTADLVGSCA